MCENIIVGMTETAYLNVSYGFFIFFSFSFFFFTSNVHLKLVLHLCNFLSHFLFCEGKRGETGSVIIPPLFLGHMFKFYWRTFFCRRH